MISAYTFNGKSSEGAYTYMVCSWSIMILYLLTFRGAALKYLTSSCLVLGMTPSVIIQLTPSEKAFLACEICICSKEATKATERGPCSNYQSTLLDRKFERGQEYVSLWEMSGLREQGMSQILYF